MTTKTKQIIIALVVILIGFFVLKAIFGTPAVDPGSDTVVTDTTDKPQVGGEEILRTLKKLDTIKLDDNISSKESFRSLKDNSVTIVPPPFGRINPFAPINLVGSASVTGGYFAAPSGTVPFINSNFRQNPNNR